MVWEAGLWCGLALGGSVGIPALTASLGRRGGSGAPEAAWALPWLNILPLYLALITGAVSGRDAGLYGRDASGWAIGLLICGLVVAPAMVVLWWRAEVVRWPPAGCALAEEARWALYRASGTLWIGHMLGGTAAGLVLGALEWVLQSRRWRARASLRLEAWQGLGRVLVSSLLFALTCNAWLTAAAHLALLAFARWMARPARDG